MKIYLANKQMQYSVRKYSSSFGSKIFTRSIITKCQQTNYKPNTLKQSTASFSTHSDLSLQERGIYDHRNLLKFDTIHELQTNATIAFADNPIFGTYTEREGQDAQFEYMTYKDYGEKVDTCRVLLKDLGT